MCRLFPSDNAATPVVAAATDESVTGALMVSAGSYAPQTMALTQSDLLVPCIASLHSDGPVTTVLLLHLVHLFIMDGLLKLHYPALP